jgi:hypothetical protein
MFLIYANKTVSDELILVDRAFRAQRVWWIVRSARNGIGADIQHRAAERSIHLARIAIFAYHGGPR